MKEHVDTDRKEKKGALNAVIAYHANCIDGFTSAWITRQGLIDSKASYSINFIAMSYDEASYKSLHNWLKDNYTQELYIVDFSVPLSWLKKYGSSLLNNPGICNSITILDHHKTAFERYMPEGYEVKPDSYIEEYPYPNTYIQLDNARSGAGVCWNYFSDSDRLDAGMPALVKYVQDYDLWKFEHAETKAINKYLRSVDMNFAMWDLIAAALEDTDSLAGKYIIYFGERLLKEHTAQVEKLADTAIDITLEGIEGKFVCCTYEFVSDVGNAVALRYGFFCAMCDFRLDLKVPTAHPVTWSLRSVGDQVDVSALAKSLGGGGHKNAAGFTISSEQSMEILSKLKSKEYWA